LLFDKLDRIEELIARLPKNRGRPAPDTRPNRPDPYG
jgi:hypothetical protein